MVVLFYVPVPIAYHVILTATVAYVKLVNVVRIQVQLQQQHGLYFILSHPSSDLVCECSRRVTRREVS
jgi:hypothetical protein